MNAKHEVSYMYTHRYIYIYMYMHVYMKHLFEHGSGSGFPSIPVPLVECGVGGSALQTTRLVEKRTRSVRVCL